MTIYASEPGTRLGGRYRLEDRIAAGSGWAAWKAIDEILARAVTVFTFAPGFPRVTEVVTAARAASRLTDPRLAQVFDVEDAWDRAYIVMEWAAGETLGDQLSNGPLEPFRAARMMAEAAAALSSAHAAGVAHMCLSPGSVRWSQTGEVKVVGLGIDAALSGTSADDPVIADTTGLGRLLYAGLTGHWPGPEYPPLPPAPLAGGQPRTPRQVVGSVPAALSDLAIRAMGVPAGPQAPPFTSPGELSKALLAAVPPMPVPAAPPPPVWRDREREREQPPRYGSDPDRRQPWDRDDYTAERYRGANGGHAVTGRGGAANFGSDTWPPEGQDQRSPGRHGGSGRRAPRRRAGLAALPMGVSKTAVVAGVAVLAVVAVAAFTLWPSGGGAKTPGPTGKPTTSVASIGVLTPVEATGFDPLTSPQKDPGNEESSLAQYAIDGNPSTAWDSQWYSTPEFGLLKTGSGLLINMGKAVRFDTVTVTFNSMPGADVQLLVGNSSERSKANLESMTTIASANNPTGTYTFRITNRTTGQYLVIWFTRLPAEPKASNKFQAEIFNVTVRGTS